MISFSQKLPKGYFYTFNQKPEIDFLHVHQVHGNLVLGPENCGDEADGLFCSFEKPHILGIKTADCLPIVILGEEGYAHLHAGWRGVHQKIHLSERVHGLRPTYCFVGPHIQKENFEVTEDFKENFPNSADLFLHIEGKLTFNLFEQVSRDLLEKYPKMEIINCKRDTYAEKAFHSYRRDATAERNWNLFSLKSLNT